MPYYYAFVWMVCVFNVLKAFLGVFFESLALANVLWLVTRFALVFIEVGLTVGCW